MPVYYPDASLARKFKVELPKSVSMEKLCFHLRIGFETYNAMKEEAKYVFHAQAQDPTNILPEFVNKDLYDITCSCWDALTVKGQAIATCMLIKNASPKTNHVYKYASWKPACLNWIARAILWSIYPQGERHHLVLGCSSLFPTPPPDEYASLLHEEIEVPWKQSMDATLHLEKQQVEVFVKIYHRFIYGAFPIFDTKNIIALLGELSKPSKLRNSRHVGVLFQVLGLASLFAERAYGWEQRSKELLGMAKNYGILKGVVSKTGDIALFEIRTLVLLEYILTSDYVRAMAVMSVATYHLQKLTPKLSAETSFTYHKSLVHLHYVMSAGPDDWIIASTATPAPIPQVTPTIFGFTATKYFDAEGNELMPHINEIIDEIVSSAASNSS
ncbi:hypothetical protein F5884DRAFT_756191 [Xylogone sp. PMI_703]|nr:hypothetical protein F5884DRAFT_756191 [Xylogone sp. PMI_703]